MCIRDSLLPDADDSQQGEQDGDDDAHRSQRAEEPGGSVAALIVLGKDGGKELHGTHAQQAAHRVEDGKQGALLGVCLLYTSHATMGMMQNSTMTTRFMPGV